MELLDKSIAKYDAKGRDVFQVRGASAVDGGISPDEGRGGAREEAGGGDGEAAADRRSEGGGGCQGARGDLPAFAPALLQTFVAKTGDVVKNSFRIQEIRYESVVIAYVDPRFQGQSRELALSRGRS
jgi:hypothetical protein